MRTVLSEQAKQEIRKTAKYIRKEFGKQRRDDFMKELREIRQLIESNPYIGSVEPQLAELPDVYRSYVMDRFDKIVYRIDDDFIYIADFWDVRRDPQTLAAQVK